MKKFIVFVQVIFPPGKSDDPPVPGLPLRHGKPKGAGTGIVFWKNRGWNTRRSLFTTGKLL